MRCSRFLRTTFAAVMAVALLLVCLPLGTAAAGENVEKRYYAATLDNFKLGYTGWGDKIALSAAEKGGVTYTFKNAGTGVCAGYTRPVTLSGFHVSFSGVQVEPGADHGRIGLIFGDTNIARWVDSAGSATMLIWLDTDTGKVTVHPGNNTIISSNDLKKENLGTDPFDFSISEPDGKGDRVVTVAGHEGTLTKAQVAKSPAIKDLDEMYFSITGCASCTMQITVDTIHGGNSPCLAEGGVKDLEKVDAAIAAIDAIGTVTKDSAAKIAAARKAYDALGKLKPLVGNAGKLEAAEQTYKVLSLKPATFDAKNIVLTVGAITDTHNTDRFAMYYDALEGHTNKGFDIVVNAGDITDGTVYYNTTHEIPNIKKVFKNSLGDTPYLFCLGNHDSDGGSNAERFYEELGEWYYRNDLDKAAAEKGNRHMKVGNYHFIALEGCYTGANSGAGFSRSTLTWFRSTLEAIVKDPTYKGEYIFLVTHAPVHDTVYGSEEGGTTGLNDILADFPQIITMTGHSHKALSDERSIMQNDIGTFLHLGGVQHLEFPFVYVESVEPWLVENSYDYPTGCLVEVDKNGAVRITRYDLLKDKQLKEPWILPAPAADKSHLLYYTDARAGLGGAPAFPKGTVAAVYHDGKNVEFYIDAAKDEDMVFSYVIDVIKDGKTVKTLESLSGFYKYPQIADMPAHHITLIKDFPAEAPYTLKIRAKDSWGHLSDAVTLNVGKAAAGDQEKADDVAYLIDDLADATAADAAAVKAARAAYGKLTDAQKPLVDNYAVLIAAEEAVAAGTGKTTAPTKKTTATKPTEAGDTPNTEEPADTDTPAVTEEPQTETAADTEAPITDTPADTDEPQTETVPDTDEPETEPTGKKNILPVGAIIGIAAGAAVLIAAVVVTILLILKKKKAQAK